MRFTTVVLRSDARQGHTMSSSLPLGAASETQVLEPGDYTLRVEARDALPFETKVTVERGKTVEIQVDMKPK